MDIYLGEEKNPELISRLKRGEAVPVVGYIAIVGTDTRHPKYELVIGNDVIDCQQTAGQIPELETTAVSTAKADVVASADELVLVEQFKATYVNRATAGAEWGWLKRRIQATNLPIRLGRTEDGASGIIKSTVQATLEQIDSPDYRNDALHRSSYALRKLQDIINGQSVDGDTRLGDKS